MTNKHQSTANTDNTQTTKAEAAGCCGGPAPAGTEACCIKDAVAKAAGERGCGCGTEVPRAASGCC